MPVKKNRLLQASFILIPILSTVVVGYFIGLADAQPYIHGGVVPPKPDEIPPCVSIFYPENKTSFNSNNITFVFNVNMSAKGEYISEVTYNADWLQNSEYVYRNHPYISDFNTSKDFSLNLAEIPEGSHFIEITATELGEFIESGGGWPVAYWYFISGYSSILFTIDLTSPLVSVLSLENKVFDSGKIPLNFTVSESVSQVAYSLDGNENVTVAGNTTLTELPDGYHNITVYATDKAGNVGISETIYFRIESFPTIPVIAVIIVAVLGIGLLVYFKKRKK